MKLLSSFRLVLRGLSFYRRIHLGVFSGVMLATAILTGALILGDSSRHTLRETALARLAGARYALYLPNRFFDRALTDRLADKSGRDLAGILQVRAMAFSGEPSAVASMQVNQAHVFGVDAGFWNLASWPGKELAAQEAVVNERLATTLGLQPGQSIALRIVKPGIMALDAPLSPGGNDSTVRVLLKVREVLPDRCGGRFNLLKDQASPFNVFVRLDWLQETLDLGSRINIALAGNSWSGEYLQELLRETWRLEDVGARLRSDSGGVLQLESDRVFLDPALAKAALAVPGAAGTLAYLVNSISSGDFSTPYSFAVAGGAVPEMHDSEAVVNAWLADKLHIGQGDKIRVAWYEVTPANAFVERQGEFTVKAVRAMEEMEEERRLMPEFPGLSDVESCSDWDIGMPMDEESLKDADNEAYWKVYRQTPKLMVTLESGRKMWGNRFGDCTAVRFPGGAEQQELIRDSIMKKITPGEVGLAFISVQDQALRAVEQALDLGGLFLGMSFFLVTAALILTATLFLFGVQQRSGEMGVLLVMGWRPMQVWRLLLSEGIVISSAGALAGTALGMLYARLLLFGLGGFWEGAVAGTELAYHAAPRTLVTGCLAGIACAVASISWGTWRQCRVAAARLLLSDQSLAVPARPGQPGKWLQWAVPGMGACLAVLGAVGVIAANPPSVAPYFFGIGALLLASGIVALRLALLRLPGGDGKRFSRNKLALYQVARRPGRSAMVAAVLACGLFLALSVISMREDLGKHAGERWSGTGGFELFGQTTAPLGETPQQPGMSFVSLRVREGDDASCLNLNRAAEPRLYGVDPGIMKNLGSFDRALGEENAWALLEQPLPDGAIPALVGDRDTAMWGLKARTGPDSGDTRIYRDESGREVRVRLVGTLPMRLSVFQGSLLISMNDFTRLFPSESGFRAFLIDLEGVGADQAIRSLNQEYEKAGMDTGTALARLEMYYEVETTYLHMFLLLGGLGVTLGALGMGIVAARNLLERRGELAMMQAMGFPERSILAMLFLEHAILLAAAVLLGMGSSLVALFPSLLLSTTTPPVLLQLLVVCLVLGSGMASLTVAIVVARPRHLLSALRME